MKRILMLVAVALLAFGVAVPAQSQSREPMAGCQFTALGGPVGMLELVGAPGAPYLAWNAEGMVVAGGMLMGQYAAVPALTGAPAPDGTLITVLIGGQVLSVGSDDNGWVFE